MRTRSWIAGTLAAAAAGLSLQVTAAAVAPGPFGSSGVVVSSVSGILSQRSATLLDGSVGVVWTDGATIHMTVRRSGQASFPGTTLTYTPPVAFATIVTGAPLAAAVSIVALTPSTFLVGWAEHGTTGRVMSATVGASASVFPTPVLVSGTQDVATSSSPAFAGLPDGSAAAVWLVAAPFGYQITVNRRVGLTGAWQPVSASSVAGITTSPIVEAVALDSAQTVSAAWISAGSLFQTIVRSRTASGQWGLPVVAGSYHAAMYSGLVPLMSLSSSGANTVVASIDDLTGTAVYPGDPIPTGINVLSLSRGSHAWALSVAGLTGSGRHAVSPRVSTLPDGSAVVRYADYSPASVGTPTAATEISTRVLQRRGTAGKWSAPILLDASASVAPTSSFEIYDWSPTLLADGTYATGVPLPLADVSSPVAGAGLVVRSGWAGSPDLVAASGPLIGILPVAAAINATGRATLTYGDAADSKYRDVTSALTKPMPFGGPSLPASVRKARAARCSVGWAEATSATSYRWFRNGVAIAGATASSYIPRAADVGKALKCRASVANSKGTTTLYSVGRKVAA